MKMKIILAVAGLLILFGNALSSNAQVKRVEMHIGGYLCGNWVYNIQKAVSRLDYAPKLKEVEITDIKKGPGVFVPKPDKAVSIRRAQTNAEKSWLRARYSRYYDCRKVSSRSRRMVSAKRTVRTEISAWKQNFWKVQSWTGFIVWDDRHLENRRRSGGGARSRWTAIGEESGKHDESENRWFGKKYHRRRITCRSFSKREFRIAFFIQIWWRRKRN